MSQTTTTSSAAGTHPAPEHHAVVIVGGGQAGLSVSHFLKQRGIGHLVLERNEQPMQAWQTRRWDAFCLVTPNWQCRLPGWDYAGNDPHGFMRKDELNAWLAGFAAHVDAPLRTGVAVRRVAPRRGGGWAVSTSKGEIVAGQVVVASGGYQVPIIPRLAERLPGHVVQLHSEQYRNPQSLPPGRVLVVGNGQSGAQIAEDLHLAGRQVVLATGEAPRCARFYRGRDVVDWLADMGYYDMAVTDHPLREGVRDNTNHYVTGRDGGRDIDLRRFAAEGLQLYGTLSGLDGSVLRFAPNLRAHLDHADRIYNGINASIDKHIDKHRLAAPPASVYQPVWQPAQERTTLDLNGEPADGAAGHGGEGGSAAPIGSVVWCIGFEPDFGWLDAPVFNGRGQPGHVRGVTAVPGLYFVGLPWLHTWGSGRFSGIARDAQYLAEQIEARCLRPEAAADVAGADALLS